MHRVLVTGATGFIGGQLADTLIRQGSHVRCLVRRTSDTRRLQQLGARLVEGDVTQAAGLDKAVADVDVVFHLAGLTTALSKTDLYRANADGPGLIAAACAKRQTPPILVLVSSLAAAGPSERDVIRVESDPAAPISNYGRSKLAGETAASKWASQVPLTIVRPGMIFGPRDHLALPIFKTIATWGVHPVVGLGRNKIALLYVDDLCDLLIRAASDGERVSTPANDVGEPGTGVYFASHDRALSFRELGSLIAYAMNRRVIPLPLYPPIAASAAAVNQLRSQLQRRSDGLNIDKIREARQPSWESSNAKAKRQLNWKPTASLEEQIRETVDWYAANDWIRIRRLLPKPIRQ
jgi:nucleoside-diphosphate-sugar epimerase